MIDAGTPRLSPRDEALRTHLVVHLGAPERMVTVDDAPDALRPLYVVEFGPPPEEAAWAYATVGASRTPMEFPDPQQPDAQRHRIELFLCANERHPDLVQLLARLAAYPYAYRTYLGRGHTVAGTAGDGVVPGSPLTDLLLTAPEGMPPGFDYVDLDDGTHVELVWVVPVYTSERLLAVQQGWRALEQRFRDQATDPADLRRAAVA